MARLTLDTTGFIDAARRNGRLNRLITDDDAAIAVVALRVG